MTDSGGDDRAGDDEAEPVEETDLGAEAEGKPERHTESGSSASADRTAGEDVGYVEWLRTTDEPSIVILQDVVSSVATVVLIGVLLFALSGLWPPLVAVESGSMEPHMYRGDLVFVMEEGRFAPDQAVDGTGVVTYAAAREVDRTDASSRGYRSFGSYGNVIVYERNGQRSSPIIHRAHLYVEEDERWVERANDDYLAAGATCNTVDACPAPYDGFITKGDANERYDQAGARTQQISNVVKAEWVRGRAKARIPLLGHVRLLFGSLGGDPTPTAGGSLAGGVVPLSARLFAVCSVGAVAAYGTRR